MNIENIEINNDVGELVQDVKILKDTEDCVLIRIRCYDKGFWFSHFWDSTKPDCEGLAIYGDNNDEDVRYSSVMIKFPNKNKGKTIGNLYYWYTTDSVNKDEIFIAFNKVNY